jgi:hypothetical protein
LDAEGNVSAAVTTSGMSFKAVGRVGDSPIAGAGLYADAEAGAAVATGDGDHIARFCPSIKVVEAMGRGMSPNDAAAAVIGAIFARVRRSGHPMFEVVSATCALNPNPNPNPNSNPNLVFLASRTSEFKAVLSRHASLSLCLPTGC